MKKLLRGTGLLLAAALFMGFMARCTGPEPEGSKPRIIVSTDIGGTDPDDFQSLIHLLMYADQFHIEGLVSSPFGKGRKKDLLHMIDLYEKDFDKLRTHSDGFPEPEDLRGLCKQGATEGAPFKGFATTTEGSDRIVRCAQRESDQPLWVLVWGGIEDLAQALHDAPGITEKIRVYWIGGPNKKWSVNAYAYIAQNHPDLWMIEANATYRGWFMDSDAPDSITNEAYYDRHILNRGEMGRDFKNYYDGQIKMGDTPSLAYLMNGDPSDPAGDSWGGSFTRIDHSTRLVFDRNTTLSDTVAAYATLEWRYDGPVLDIDRDSTCFYMEVSNQKWPGYCLGDGLYAVRYSPKSPDVFTYHIISDIPELNGQAGQFVSTIPWPGKPGPDDYGLGPDWYSDRPGPEWFLGNQQGAGTVSRFRTEYLSDWAKRWEWLR